MTAHTTRRRDIRACRRDKRRPWTLQSRDSVQQEQQDRLTAAFDQLEHERALQTQRGLK
ncbi:hypothetical protein OU995_21430 [Roseateles sp. SL47]|uniref:hypothetical protein n=1 Tax=Roseateles sp. SL47 TaxID=2995138 RepID=UPI00226D44C8|nr:hypothetical protein [Roseateles sp. SL47]WAC72106.1 hypothetical protein OU995_21430 [Roseateles sp. SL47]